jgi:hypothetical protein
MSFEQIKKKIREARFFFDKMIVQEAKAFGKQRAVRFLFERLSERNEDYRLPLKA